MFSSSSHNQISPHSYYYNFSLTYILLLKENHDSEKGERLSIKSITKSKTQFCYKNYGAKKRVDSEGIKQGGQLKCGACANF